MPKLSSEGGRNARGALRPVAEWLRSRHAAFDEHLVNREAVHMGIAGKLALLHRGAFALIFS